MKPWAVMLCLAAATLVWSPRASAQTPTGTLLGIVEDETRAALPGASVAVKNTDTGIARSLTTDAAGRYRVSGLIPGAYEIVAELEGFQRALKAVQLTVGSGAVVNLMLRIGAHEETTVVTAERPLVDSANSSVYGVVDEVTIRELPLNARSYDQLITLQAGAPLIRARGRSLSNGPGEVFSVSGARTLSNQYFIDGTEILGAGSNTSTPGGALGTNMGVEAIQEFAVLTSNYSAAYGKRAGGVISIATKSGGNAFHGSGFEFYRDGAMDAKNFFDRSDTTPDFARHQFGGAIGGPIRRDHTFFFANYEAMRQTLQRTNIAIVPDENARNGLLRDPRTGQLRNVGVAPGVKPYMVLFPPLNGRNFGDGTGENISLVSQPARQDFFLARVDHTLSNLDSIFARYNLSQAHLQDPDNNPLFHTIADSRDQVLTIEARRSYPTLLNTLRFGYTRAFIISDSQPLEPLDKSLNFVPWADTIGRLDFGTSQANPLTQAGTGGSPGRFFIVNLFDLQYQVSHSRGAHALQFAVQGQRVVRNEDFLGIHRGEFEFADFESFLQAKPTSFVGLSTGPDGKTGTAFKKYRQTFFSTYVQDDYRAARNLTLNLGLRYELMTVPVEVDGNRISNFHSTMTSGTRFLDTSPTLGSPFYNGYHKAVAPRVGFVWSPGDEGKTSLRGGYGLYYEQIEHVFRFFTARNVPFTPLNEVRNGAFPQGFATSAGVAPVPSPDSVDFDIRPSRRDQWSLGMQRQLGPRMALTANYIGSRSMYMTRVSNANAPVPQILADGSKYFVNKAPLKNPRLGRSRYVTSDASGDYHGVQLELNQQLSDGLRAKVSFVYAKSIDDASSVVSQESSASPSSTMDPDDIGRDRGLSAYDLRRNLVMNLTYELPAGNLAGPAAAILGGWQISGILTLQDGTPFTVLAGSNRSRNQTGSGSDRPNVNPAYTGNPVLGGPDRYFDPTAFQLQPAGYYGNAGRNTLIMPGVATLDISVVKRTARMGAARLDLRLEAFNLLNRANLGKPDANAFLSDGSIRGAAGLITETSTTARQIQVGAKLTF